MIYSNRVSIFSTASLCAIAMAACAQTELEANETNETADAIYNTAAMSASNARASGVVAVTTRFSSASATRGSTGVLVSPGWVLGAASGILNYDADNNGEIDPANLAYITVRLGNGSDPSAQTRTAKRVIRHPSARWATPNTAVDVALIQVDPFDVSSVIPGHFSTGEGNQYLQLLNTPSTSLLGAKVRSFGFGLYGYTVNPSGSKNWLSDDNLRQSYPTVTAAGSGGFVSSTGQAEGNICGGDPGGPVFVEDWAIDGNGSFGIRSRVLAGVHSFGDCQSAPYEAMETGADAFRTWVMATVGGYSSGIDLNCTDTTCSLTPASLPDYVSWSGVYAPRGTDQNKCYYVTATYDMETGFDFVTIAGQRLTGAGTYTTHFCGALPIAVSTDLSIASHGVTLSASDFAPAVATGSSCGGTTGTWSACLGNGCSVCTVRVKDYPKYYANHPSCTPNTACGNDPNVGSTCNANCPAPTAADR